MADDYAGGCTPWGRYEVPELAGFLAEDLGRGWTHARAWYCTADLAAGYREALQRIRDALGRIWPPERSPAAAVYLSRLDSMIASLADAHEAAAANGDALTGVLTTLEGTRGQVDEIHEQWKALGGAVSVDPGFGGDTSWQVPLNEQAQRYMQHADNAVYAYQARMVVPQEFHPGPPPWDPGPSVDGSGGSRGSAGPVAGVGRPLRPPAVPPVRPPSPSDATDPRTSEALPSGHGPVLSGGPLPVSGQVLPVDSADLGQDAGPEARLVPRSGAGWSWMVDTPRGRVLRAGGVIGPTPAPEYRLPDGTVQAAPVSTPKSTSPRAPGSGRPGQSGEPETPGLMAGTSGIGSRSGRDRYRRRSEPYVEWEVPRGVPPVIEPGPEPKHDPGPGVIGIDR